MKAIINVRKGSVYNKYNGLTFEVSQLWNHSVDLIGANPEFPSNSVNFTFDEIIIVDIQEEVASTERAINLKKIYPTTATGYKDPESRLAYLQRYCELKKIQIN